MAAKDWQRVESLFHTALQLKGEVRDDYLAQVCSDDAELRQQVESLIAAFENNSGFMEEPAFNLGMRLLSDSRDDAGSLIGQSVGHYKIVRALGQGGMGEVYLAEDDRLGRKVALKFLSSKLVNDNWAKRQLVREAQAVAMLDHQNICGVYGIEDADGRSFIVMQYIEGKSLSEFIQDGLHDTTAALRLAIQIVSALAEAHAHGIIHRDIKPQNIMLTANGQVKVLDFGLAKHVQRKQDLSGGMDKGNETSQLGLIIGTVAYMSPEQLRAEKLDYRSDIFSCGTVLYELLSGANPYARQSKAETISAILTSQPLPLRRLSPTVSPELSHVVHKCMEKDRDKRYQSASELLYELGNLQEATKPRPAPGHSLKVLRAVATMVLLVLLAATAAFIYLRITRVRTLAILPISNESSDSSADYLGDGLTESLINRLDPLSQLQVKAFTTISGYNGRSVDPQAVGRDLNVDAVLVGKIVKRNDSLILQTRLIKTVNGSQLWVNEYNIRLEEIFSLQEDLSRNVIASLEFWPGSESATINSGTENTEAFRQYMLGRYYWRNRDRQNIERAISHFNEAIRLDSKYAQAHAGLADCYVLLSIVAYGSMPTNEAMSKASVAAIEALVINNSLPEAYTSLGVISLRYNWDWQDAERKLKRAIELNPDYAPSHYWYSNLLMITGRQKEAIAESENAKNLDPFSPPSIMNFCRSFYFAREYDRAASCFDGLLREKPDYKIAQYMLGLVYQQVGREEEATEIFRKLYENDKSLAGAALGYAYGRAGRRADALKILGELEDLSRRQYIPPQEFAIIYMGLSDNDSVFAWLEKAYAERFATLTYLTADPLFQSLHTDPRFADLARRLKLPLSPPA